MNKIAIVIVSLILAIIGLVGCTTISPSPPAPQAPAAEAPPAAPAPKPAPSPAPAPEEWELLNRWLSDLYGLPQVEDIEQMQAAALLVSGLWFEQADKAVKKLEEDDIPWARTAPFCYTYNYYILHDIQLTNASTPLEFMATDNLLADTVKDLQDEAEELVRMKWLGEPLHIFPTTKDAMDSFREIDKDWDRLMEEAISKSQ